MKFDKDTLLVVNIIQESVRVLEFRQFNPTKFAKLYEDEIKATGQLFEYLGLAKRDKTNPIGWKPTDQLLEFIAKPPSRKKRKKDFHEDGFIFDLLSNAVFGEDAGERGLFAILALGGFGFARQGRSGGLVPTLLLRDLFCESYHARREGRPPEMAHYREALLKPK
jgi:hypothetical protein